jgi:hypothetical protein
MILGFLVRFHNREIIVSANPNGRFICLIPLIDAVIHRTDYALKERRRTKVNGSSKLRVSA